MTKSQSVAQTAAVARTPAQRGPFGRWLTEAREARYKRQVDALEAMRRLAGLTIAPSEFAQWESGSRVPRPDNPKVARLYEFFGSRPTEPLEATESGDSLVRALRDQTAAINELVAEIRLSRDEEAVTREALMKALGVALAQRETPATDGHDIPVGAGR